jgi:hypothetical protein
VEPESLSREDLLRHIAELNAETLSLRERLRQAADQSDWAAGAMKARTRLLNERVKELDCICRAVRIFRDPALRGDQRIGRIVDLLPRAWQHPDLACARARIGQRDFCTQGFRETPWLQRETILARGRPEGIVEVRYLKELPAADEGPFLREERALLKVVAELLGAACESAPRPGP